jgi:glutaredoxin
MKLYTCPGGTKNGKLGHPCGKAASALDDAGHAYEVQKVKGMRMLPWTRSGDARAEIERISGQKDVPVLALDDGTTVAGTRQIIEWAKANPGG